MLVHLHSLIDHLNRFLALPQLNSPMAYFSHQCLWITLAILAIWAYGTKSRSIGDMPMRLRHEQWMAEYGREYKDAAEKEYRYQIFKANVEYVESVNKAGDRKYELGINQFADLTNEEFKASHNGYKPKIMKPAKTFRYQNVTAAPTSIDWRTEGAVTPIKDQGECGNEKISGHIEYELVLVL